MNSITSESGIDMQRMTKEQGQSDFESWPKSFKIERLSLLTSDGAILCDVSTEDQDPYAGVTCAGKF